jgi:polyhydroxyalkanoate synthesis repressor PhaR
MTSTSERLIKKYANRRLYDAAASRHVTLDDLRTLIAQGEQIKVVDDKTGEDITRSVLLQIVTEQEQFGRPILSAQLLHSIVRFYGTAMEEITGQYLEKSVEKLLEQQEAVSQNLRKLMNATSMTGVMELTRQNMELWRQLQEQMLATAANAKDSTNDPQ